MIQASARDKSDITNSSDTLLAPRSASLCVALAALAKSLCSEELLLADLSTRSWAKRAIFQSLLQRLRPAITDEGEKAWERAAERLAMIPRRKASEPYSAITSIGLMTFPLLLLIF